jgi:PRTRC genetic system protein B
MSTVEIQCEGVTEVSLQTALLIYSNGRRDEIYITQHDVKIVGQRPMLMAGVPVTKDALAQFADVAAVKTAYSGFVPDRVIYVARNTVAWWTPAQRRRVWFKADAPIGERSAEVSHPPLMFVARNDKWYVFALKDDARPTPKTKLFRAPYFNVWDEGEICTGNVELPTHAGPETLSAYEEAFFRSRFTHSNSKKLIHGKGGAKALWLSLLDGADFPMDQLVNVSTTVQQFFERLSSGD